MNQIKSINHMKITILHYNQLKELFINVEPVKKHTFTHLQNVYVKEHKNGAIKAKDIYQRLRWDLFYAINIEKRQALMDVLYKYLNDNHIDTALKNITKDLLKSEAA